METNELTPEKSFEIITDVINEARNRFEENGFIYVFWGILVTIASLGQFFLLKAGHEHISYYPYFLMPLGAIYTGYYFSKRKKGNMNIIGRINSAAWITLASNMIILGFVFGSFLRENLDPVILILMAAGIIISGVSLKSKLLVYSGIFINLSAFVCFKLPWEYHSVLMAVVALVAIFIPGIILMVKHNRSRNVQ
jgi:hypothetical protein